MADLAVIERTDEERGERLPSVTRVLDDWYVVCRSEELKRKPLATTLFGAPLVVFRTKRGVGALLDRCPHRNVPLSLGRVVDDDRLRCGYHGWEFDEAGAVRHIPCLVGEPEAGARRTQAFAAREQQGYVWVYATPDVEPAREPFSFPLVGDRRYTTVRAEVELDGTVHAVAENALDVPHTAYLHGGLFRTPEREHEIDVVIRRWHDRCEAEYIGEPRPSGVMGRLLAPRGGEVTHFDRFFLPSITQVEYRLGDDSHLVVNAALTPLSEFRTRLYGLVTFRVPVPVPGGLLARLLRPVGLFILGQDARMLKVQADTIRRFGEEKLVSTEVDCLGPHILKLLRDAERGRRDERERPFERRVKMRV